MILFFLVASIDSRRQRRQANGCGPELGPDVNQFIGYIRMDVLIKCCDHHDNCYDNCTSNKRQCDDDFHQCLHDTCDSIERTGFEFWIKIREWCCKRLGDIMYQMTNLFGQGAFNRAREKKGCP